MSTTETTWVPPSVLDRMAAELAALEADPAPSPDRAARLRVLRHALRRAEASAKPDDGVVEPGMSVTVRFDGDADPTTFLLGSRDLIAAEPTIEIDVYSPGSPLGRAVTGAVVGDTVRYVTPSGRSVSARIVSTRPYTS